MAKTNKVTLDEFIAKATKRYQDRKTNMEIDVEGIGTLTFTRPSENKLLKYMSEVASAVVTDKDGNQVSQDLNMMVNASKNLIYATCSFLNNTELQKSLEVVDPLDIVTKVFGVTKAIEISGKISTEFIDAEIQSKIKN